MSAEEKKSLRDQITDRWETLNANQKRYFALGGLGVVAILMIIWTIMSTPAIRPGGNQTAQTTRPQVDPNVFGGGRSNILAVEALEARIEAEARENQRIRRELEAERERLEQTREDFITWAQTSGIERDAVRARRELETIQQRIEELAEQAETMELEQEGIARFQPGFRNLEIPEGQDRPAPPSPRPEPEVLPEDLFSGTGFTEPSAEPSPEDLAERITGERQQAPPEIERRMAMVINGETLQQRQARLDQEAAAAAAQAAQEAQNNPAAGQAQPAPRPTVDDEIPLASIVSGVLLHGMDAPTGQGSRGQPVPALIRIKDLSILPNNLTADIEDCHAIGAGFGSLSEERAFMRLEDIACTTPDGEILTAEMQGYVVGPDGKVGIRGPVVQRNGQLIARSIQAGVLAGFGQALGGRGRSQFTIGDGGIVRDDYDQIAEEGLARGIGTALQQVSEYYLSLADSIFPVIEIFPETPVDIVLTSPIEFP